MPRIPLGKAGGLGLLTAFVGVGLLLFTFNLALGLYQTYKGVQLVSPQILETLNQLLGAAIQALFLGVMGWVGSILLLRGVDFLKVDRGVGIVTLRVDKGTGVVTGLEQADAASKKAGERTS